MLNSWATKIAVIMSVLCLSVVLTGAYLLDNQQRRYLDVIEHKNDTIDDANIIIDLLSYKLGESYIAIGTLEERVSEFEVSGYLPWNTDDELRDWLYYNTVSEREYEEDVYDCDDFADDLIEDARKDGYLIGLVIRVGDKTHAMNVAYVGNDIYLIYPQTDVVQKIGVVD